jgi:esterase/lipase superfamily enzyme
MRRLDIIMAIGRDDPSRPNNEQFSQMLWDKGIGNALRIWDGWAHDWPYWEKMIRMYVGGHD